MTYPTALRILTALLAFVATGVAAPVGSLPEYRAGQTSDKKKVEDTEGEKGEEADKEKEEEVKLTLDRIFPKKSFFGPSARSTGFSFDGRFCAFLYRPLIERRHGNDLYLYDTKTGQSRRITCVSRMAEYQADARKVSKDRKKKAKKAGVTQEQLAGEQVQRLHGDGGSGQWKGEATHRDGDQLVAAGDCELKLAIGSKGWLEGELRIGLVRLTLGGGTLEEGRLTARIEQDSPKVKGALALEIGDSGLSGTLTFEEPKQVLDLKLEKEETDKPHQPRGIIGTIGERLTLGDVVLEDDADINDEKDGKRPDPRIPRYGGVRGYEWSRKGPEMLVFSGGDVYQLQIDVQQWDAPIEAPDIVVPREEEEDEKEGDSDEEDDAEEADDGEDRTSDDDDDEQGDEEDDDEGDGKDDDEVEEHDDDEDDGDHHDEDDGDHDDEHDGDDDDEKGDNEGGEDGDETQESGEESGDDPDTDKSKEKKKELKPLAPYRGELTRLTRTRGRETDVQYLPDGTGYTYLRAGALVRVSFGDHTITQLDPELEDGERMVGYRISPDQKRLVFLANRGDSTRSSGRQVTIVNYRERFARTRKVNRHMPDDPWPEAWSSVYLYDLKGHETEEGMLERVFTRRLSGPRDVLRVPEWSPDSSRIAFAAYDQATGHIKILEAGFVDKDSDEKKDDDGEKESGEEEEGDKKTDTASQEDKDEDKKDTDDGDEAAEEEEEKEPDFKIESAKIVYQFLHAGGPNTPRMIRPQYLPDSRRLVFLTELSGFRHLHLLEPRYEQLTQLTEGQFEVYPFDISQDHSTLFVTATKDDPNQEHVFAIDSESGEMTRLTKEEGVYGSVAVSDDGKRVMATHIDFGKLRELVTTSSADEASMSLSDSHPEEAHKLTTAGPEYFTYENRHGQTIHGHMFKPADWTPQDERPLLIYVYGGPLGERKMATRGAYSGPSYFFARYMTEVHGYVTATIDPRGASGYGAVFEKANFEQVGKPQTEDLVDGARWLVEHHGVDEKRMSLHGWSFGGFQTQMVMYTEPDVFAVGIAGAGPTEWHNYNSWYSTGTIGANEKGETSLEKYSLLPLAKNLKGKLLLVHGMEDSNVLYQDTVRVYRELLKADKEVNVELFLDPTGGHGLGGDVKTIGRYRKYEDFLLRHLGKGEPAKVEEEPEEEPKAEDAKEPESAESEEDIAGDEESRDEGTNDGKKDDGG